MTYQNISCSSGGGEKAKWSHYDLLISLLVVNNDDEEGVFNWLVGT